MTKENKKIEFLKRQIKNGALPHTYLFSGIDEKGKNEAIEYLLGELQPQKLGSVNPDFCEINSDPITIDDIRLVKEKASMSPLVGEKNIFLIRNIERLSWQAAPALLKLLEEPSLASFIVATTENLEKVLPTLRSRFAHLKFQGGLVLRSLGEGGSASFNPTTKPPHEDASEFREFVRSALGYVRDIMRRSPTLSNIERTKRILKAMDALSDPTINKRLLGEYIIMVLS
ncbi:MAG: hypothetical protein Q7S12_04815 [bacterium]|nr:hypothetical protein [bacterium]